MKDKYIIEQNDNYVKYGDYGQDLSGPRHRLKRAYQRIIISCLDDSHIDIVDLGCGIGTLVNILNKKYGKKAIGIETSEAALRLAREYWPDNTYLLGDGRNWIPEGKVDAVLVQAWFYRTKHDRIKTLKHINSYIRNGGIIWFDYGGDDFLIKKRKKKLYTDDIAKDIFTVFKKYSVIRWQMIDNINGEEISKVFYIGEK